MSFVSWRVNEVEIKNYPPPNDVEISALVKGYFTGDAPSWRLDAFDIKRELEFKLLYGSQVPILGFTARPTLKIKKVIYNMPATIIIWADGTKTVVKCQSGDEYDCEKGFVMAYLKKLLGNDNTFNKEINKWVWGEE